MPDFLPRRGADLVVWSYNFNQQINDAPIEYGLTPAQATEYAQVHAAFDQAFQTVSDPATRSPSNIIAKNDAETTLRDLARLLAGIARAGQDVSAAQKRTLGLRVRKGKPTPIRQPRRAPALDLGYPTGCRVKVRLSDPRSLTRLAKPRGVAGATIFTAIGDDPPATLVGWKFNGNVSLTQFELKFPTTEPPGTKVWITARWFNPRGQHGPSAKPMYTHLGYEVSPGRKRAA